MMQQWADYLDTVTSGKVIAEKSGKVAQVRGMVSRGLAQQTHCNHAYQLHIFSDAMIVSALCYNPKKLIIGS